MCYLVFYQSGNVTIHLPVRKPNFPRVYISCCPLGIIDLIILVMECCIVLLLEEFSSCSLAYVQGTNIGKLTWEFTLVGTYKSADFNYRI